MIKGKIRISDPKTGKLLHQQDMHSFVKNFIYYMFWNKMGILDDGQENWFKGAKPVIGTGTTAEDVSQVDLANRITTFEEDITYWTKTENPDDVTLTMSKVFTNLTGATETITEIGIYDNSWLEIRDLLTTSLTVNDHQGIEVTYDIVVGEPFTRNMGEVLYAQAKNQSSNIYLLDGSLQGINTASNISIGNAGINDLSYGLVIGTDNTPMDITDYCLGAQITSGWTCTDTRDGGFVNTSGNTTNGYIIRSFMNCTGAAVTVNEVGLIGNIWGKHLWLRYLTGGITIEDGDRLQVVMKISTTM